MREHFTKLEPSGSHGGRVGLPSRAIAFLEHRSSIAVLITLTMVCGTALAHHPLPAQLRGAQLCLDASSVDATIESEGRRFTGAAATDLDEALYGAIDSMLETLRVTWSEEIMCAPTTDRLQASIQARYLNPETYRNFPDETYSLVVSLLIEPAIGTDRNFAHVVSELYSESEQGHTIDAHLTRRAQEAAVQLAVAWWEANPATRRLSNMRIVGFATGLTVLSAISTYIMLRRRRGART